MLRSLVLLIFQIGEVLLPTIIQLRPMLKRRRELLRLRTQVGTLWRGIKSRRKLREILLQLRRRLKRCNIVVTIIMVIISTLLLVIRKILLSVLFFLTWIAIKFLIVIFYKAKLKSTQLLVIWRIRCNNWKPHQTRPR